MIPVAIVFGLLVLIALGLVVEDVTCYFLGRGSLTTAFVQRHSPRGRVRLTARVTSVTKVDDRG